MAPHQVINVLNAGGHFLDVAGAHGGLIYLKIWSIVVYGI